MRILNNSSEAGSETLYVLLCLPYFIYASNKSQKAVESFLLYLSYRNEHLQMETTSYSF